MGTGTLAGDAPTATTSASRIAGVSTLKGLVLYGAIVTFAALYVYFIVKISAARPGTPPSLDATLISTAAALAGVLGSAFALEIGTTTDASATNQALSQAVDGASNLKQKSLARIWQALSLDPKSVSSASWPKTFGIWVYAMVASAVAITYVLNQNETPAAIKALAVAFGGYVIALVTAAYKNAG
jgi:tellurite resistance protein TehA-like permease